jgi:multicomponent Na+:H+ antiporter subunit C
MASTSHQMFTIVSVILFAVGVTGVIAHAHLVRKIIAFNIMGTGVFLFLVSIAGRRTDMPADPVPQAMVLTGIVVAVSVTAFALALTRRIYAETGSVELQDGADS